MGGQEQLGDEQKSLCTSKAKIILAFYDAAERMFYERMEDGRASQAALLAHNFLVDVIAQASKLDSEEFAKVVGDSAEQYFNLVCGDRPKNRRQPTLRSRPVCCGAQSGQTSEWPTETHELCCTYGCRICCPNDHR